MKGAAAQGRGKKRRPKRVKIGELSPLLAPGLITGLLLGLKASGYAGIVALAIKIDIRNHK